MNRGHISRVTMLTIKLSNFNLVEKRLEPAKGRCVTTDPKELDATERAEVSLPLTVPDVFQNGSKGSDACGGTLSESGGDGTSEWGRTDSSTDKHGNLAIKDVFCRGTVGSIDAHPGERTSGGSGIELDIITT